MGEGLVGRYGESRRTRAEADVSQLLPACPLCSTWWSSKADNQPDDELRLDLLGGAGADCDAAMMMTNEPYLGVMTTRSRSYDCHV